MARSGKRRWRTTLMVLMVIAVMAIGCGAQSGSESVEAPMAEEEAGWDAAAPGAPAPADAPQATGGDVDLDTVSRMVIYTGDLSLVVRDPTETQEEIVALVEGLDGYLAGASSNSYGDGLRRINLTLRVPAGDFNAVMDAIRDMALEVRQDSVGSEDVTQEYVDLESRLKALEAKAARLEELMDQAEDTEAVLAVYEELSETQIRIEETKGRMRYLERRAAMATITVSLTPDELARPVEVAGWRPQGTVKRAIEALIRAFQFLVDVLIWVVLVVAPIVGFIALLIWLLIRILRAIFGGKKQREEASSDTTSEAQRDDA